METNTTLTKDIHDLLYHPLNSQTREIRVLRIERSQPDEADIRCSLQTVSLNAKPVYKALSYEWGPQPTCTTHPATQNLLVASRVRRAGDRLRSMIRWRSRGSHKGFQELPDTRQPSGRVLLNSYPVVTTPNLRLALRHLEAGPFYWIDSLCIDQSNDKERGHQVRLMTEIYRNASAVLAWLGPEEGDSEKGMELLNEIEAVIAEEKHRVDFDEEFHKLLYDSLKNQAHRMQWNGLQQIFKRSYWTRLWIIQELVVPPVSDEVWLLCGSSKARFTTIGLLQPHFHLFAHDLPRIYLEGSVEDFIMEFALSANKALDIAIHAEVWRSLSRDEERHATTSNLLRSYWNQVCTDPRDKIYALLGVSLPYPHLEFPITYATSVLDVYKNFAQHEIAGSGTLDILTYAGYDQMQSSVRPSWVPDWQSNKRHCMIKIARESSGSLSNISSYSADGNILVTRAFVVGHITSLFETGTFYSNEPKEDSVESGYANGRKELHSWLDFIKNASQTPIQDTALSTTNMKNAYELLFFPDITPDDAEDKLPLTKFYELCVPPEQISPTADVSGTEKEHLLDRVLYGMRHRRQLFSINLAPPAHSANNQDLPADQDRETTMGLCSLNARIGDVVTVVRGCMYPILLRQTEEGGRYEVIGVIYVCGFMNGEALERFEEVDIELV